MIAEALELLEAEPAGPELVTLYTLPGREPRAHGHDRNRSRPPSGRSRSPRGSACQSPHSRSVGAAAPVARWARPKGSRTCGGRSSSRSNRAWAATPPSSTPSSRGGGGLRGAAARTRPRSRGVAFCERRGTTELALKTRAASQYSADLGRTQQALVATGSLADRLQAAGDMRSCRGAGCSCGCSPNAAPPTTPPTRTSSSPRPATSVCAQRSRSR